jgi:hypothetical protein|mmetsp:Transcript_15794/g.28542  ORF Transcript_15794/g.28542 Transcript_15794/m.28542 type:complete len:122 (-) Transcript_15794:181-546(-)
MKTLRAFSLVGSTMTLLFSNGLHAFVTPSSFQKTASSCLQMSDNVEQIEFKIFPDGRVEETVRGIKGKNCHSVTEKINESLGKVIDSTPTQELYEQELVVDQTVTNTQGNGDGSWDGNSTW